MNRIRHRTRIAVLALVAIAAATAIVTTAVARKVANPGAIAITSESGNMRVGDETFDFDSSNQITFNGSLSGAGVLTIPRANVVFPDQFTSVDSPVGTFNFRIRITANSDATGTLNPLTGQTTLNANLRIDIDPQGGSPPGFGGDCRITPISVALSTSKSGGVAYNTSTGRVTVADHNFSVPGAAGCGSFLGTNYNDEINGAVGIPTSDTDAVITAVTNPIAQKGLNASFTTTPSSGDESLPVAFNASGSTFAAPGTRTYAYDFDGNGTFDQTGTSPTGNFTYTNAGVYTPKLRITDSEGDVDETTRTVTVLATNPDLAVDKSHTGDFVASSNGHYSIVVRNVGNESSSGTVTVTDTLPTSLSFVSATGTGWNCGAFGQLVTCTHAGGIPISGSLPAIDLEVGVDASAVPSVSNTANVSGGGDTGPGNNSDTDVATVLTPTPDLAIDKSHEGDFLRGRRATYNFVVSNVGQQPSSGEITVSDTLPTGLTLVSAFGLGWDCSASAGTTISCKTDDVAAAGQPMSPISARVQVASNAPDPLVNTATVAVTGDTNSSNDSDTDTAHVVNAGPDLTIDKSHTAAEFITGRTETYRISVSNQGSLTAGGPIVVTDNLPAGLNYVGATGSGWACGEASGTVTCTRTVALSAGQTAPQIAIQVTPTDDAVPGVTNSADVSGPGDFDTGNNHDADPTTVRKPAPDLAITKTHVGNFIAGQVRSYSIGVRNVGIDPTTGTITVTDALPNGLTYVSAAGTGWACGHLSGTVTCTRPSPLNVNQAAPSITLNVRPTAAAVPSVTNVASVTAANDANGANNTASDPTQVALPAPNTKKITSIKGTGTIPSASPSGGNATVTFNIVLGLLGYTGTVKVTDVPANTVIDSRSTVSNTITRFGLNGGQGQSLLNDGRTRFSWNVDDLDAIGLPPDTVSINAPGYVNGGQLTAGNLTVLPK
jgi:uncharacterized repeat protein (TIGR01451 family)